MKAAALLIALLVCVGTSARAAPPEPPIPTPPELDQLYDGYDLRTVYQLWRYWIERQKGEVTEAMIAKPDALPDETAIAAPLMVFKGFGDLGQFISGDLRTYCRPKQPYGFDRATCHYVLRSATVPVHVGFEDDAPSRWMRKSFEPVRLAAHLKAEGLAPNTDWWMADRARLFAQHPSAAEMLRAEGKVARVDSRQCPAMAKAILAMETKTLAAPVDFWMVGEPATLIPPQPHGAIWTYKLELIVGGRGATIESSSPWIADVVGPVFDAARSCGMQV